MGATISKAYKQICGFYLRDWNTVYQEIYDGFVLSVAGDDSNCQILVQDVDPPIVSRGGCSATGSVRNGMISIPVRKGFYWKITGTAQPQCIFFVPFTQ